MEIQNLGRFQSASAAVIYLNSHPTMYSQDDQNWTRPEQGEKWNTREKGGIFGIDPERITTPSWPKLRAETCDVGSTNPSYSLAILYVFPVLFILFY